MRVFVVASLIASFVGMVLAHPGGEDHHDHPANNEELIARNVMVEKMHVAARKCAPQIAEFERRRVEKRDRLMRKRGLGIKAPAPAGTASVPHVTAIPKDASCVLHPEVEEGPYYIRNEYVRNDLREKERGIDLVLDIGVLDIRDCQPKPRAFLELWSCNATGEYAGYPGIAGLPTRIHDDTFLRGGMFTDENGIVEITTKYPGFYPGRTVHVHAIVRGGDWQIRENGTINSSTGIVNHQGQFFFDQEMNDAVFAVQPYRANPYPRSLNAGDRWMRDAGPGAVVKTSLLGETLDEGVLGYITVVVDGGADHPANNKNELR